MTKGFASGTIMVMALLVGLGLVDYDPLIAVLVYWVSCVFIGLALTLLVVALARLRRLWSDLAGLRWSSRLTRSALLLIALLMLCGVAPFVEFRVVDGRLPDTIGAGLRYSLLSGGFILSVISLVNSAYEAHPAVSRGRWRSRLNAVRSIVQALVLGSIVLIAISACSYFMSAGLAYEHPGMSTAAATARDACWMLIAALSIDLGLRLAFELGLTHAYRASVQVTQEYLHGPSRSRFWINTLLLGYVLPVAAFGLHLAGFPIIINFLVPPAIFWTCLVQYYYEYAHSTARQEILTA